MEIMVVHGKVCAQSAHMSSAPVFPIDPTSFYSDPYPTLAQMRATAPVCFVPELGATLFTRRDDIFGKHTGNPLYTGVI